MSMNVLSPTSVQLRVPYAMIGVFIHLNHNVDRMAPRTCQPLAGAYHTGTTIYGFRLQLWMDTPERKRYLSISPLLVETQQKQ